METKLLSRNTFRQKVFDRDNHTCIFCPLPAKDAHHIMERRLWDDGGYYLENGASVCEYHHLLCEKTDITTQDVRQAAKINNIILPEHLYKDQEYDKWGNPILPNGQRLKGELFYDLSVQKILKDKLHLFTNYVKYPRTYHLPWSPGFHDDDRVHKNTNQWSGMEVVCLEKMDGENTTWYSDYTHARSIDSANHPSRNRAKAIWASRCGDIPQGWRINVENLYAQHSIKYTNLLDYVYGFAIWNERNICLDWDTTQEWFSLLEIPTPKLLYRGIYDEFKIKSLQINSQHEEGYVLRPVQSFAYSQFRTLIGKYVRLGHVQTTKHWMVGQPIIPNSLKTEASKALS